MGSFMINLPVNPPEKDIVKTISDLKKWFKDNTDRETCSAQLWSVATIDIRRDHVEEDVRADAKKAESEFLEWKRTTASKALDAHDDEKKESFALAVSSCLEAGLDPIYLAVEFNVGRATITRWKNGKTSPMKLVRNKIISRLAEMIESLDKIEKPE